jgi:hypothetical protein
MKTEKKILLLYLFLFILFIYNQKCYPQEYSVKYKHTIDSLIENLNIHCKFLKDSIKNIKDSILNSNKGILTDLQIDSLSNISSISQANLNRIFMEQKDSMLKFREYYDMELKILKKKNKDENLFKEEAGNLETKFNDSLDEITSDFSDVMDDSADTYMEELKDLADEFTDIEKPVITFGSDISSSYSYKGRKPKINQPSISPSLTYEHPLGFSFEINMLWLTKQLLKQAEYDVALGYEYDFSDFLSAKVNYARLFYKDSSAKYSKTLVEPGTKVKVQSNPSNCISLDLSYDFINIFSIDADYAYYFGGDYNSELTLNLSHSFKFGKPLLPNDLYFNPGITFNYGMLFENNFQIKQSSGKATITNDKKTRGIALFDYELTASLSYDFSNLSASITYKLDFPVNELKSQSGSSFSSFSLGLYYSF